MFSRLKSKISGAFQSNLGFIKQYPGKTMATFVTGALAGSFSFLFGISNYSEKKQACNIGEFEITNASAFNCSVSATSCFDAALNCSSTAQFTQLLSEAQDFAEKENSGSARALLAFLILSLLTGGLILLPFAKPINMGMTYLNEKSKEALFALIMRCHGMLPECCIPAEEKEVEDKEGKTVTTENANGNGTHTKEEPTGAVQGVAKEEIPEGANNETEKESTSPLRRHSLTPPARSTVASESTEGTLLTSGQQQQPSDGDLVISVATTTASL